MRSARRTFGVTAVAAAVGLGVPGPALAAAGTPARSPAAPAVTLVAAQSVITVARGRGMTSIDPGIYAVALGSPLQFDVRESSLTAPIRLSRVIHGPGGSVKEVPLPGRLADHFKGLRDFVGLTVRNSAGKVIASRPLLFCPDVFDPQRSGLGSPASTPYPEEGCAEFMPFAKSAVWGIQQGWGADVTDFGSRVHLRLAPGTYQMTETISAPFRKALGLTDAGSSATVTVKVVPGPQGPAGQRRHQAGRTLPRLPRVPTMASPPAAALPDLVPVPSFGIRLTVQQGGQHQPAVDRLNFDASVAIDGNSQLDVQGFRAGGSPVMRAFQYFFRHGKVIGRAPAGTMVFEKGSVQEWHFQQFAQYRLLDASKTNVLLSHKESFCIAPTDGYDMLHPGVVWQPPIFGLGFNCGQSTALWVQEQLPIGWADTYIQNRDGQDFNVTGLPNGTYYIEIIANPEGLLHEATRANDISLRKIILGGTPAHRTVTVPPYGG